MQAEREWPVSIFACQVVFLLVLAAACRSYRAASVVTVPTSRGSPEPAGEIGRSCREFSRIRGALQEVDKYALVRESRRTDLPMQFSRSETEIPGCLLRLNGE